MNSAQDQCNIINTHMSSGKSVYVYFVEGNRTQILGARTLGTMLQVKCLGGFGWSQLSPTAQIELSL